MGIRKLKKWPGKKVHRGDWVRGGGSWTGREDDIPKKAQDERTEYEEERE
jgi:hypothetical protein